MGILITKETDEGTVYNWTRYGGDTLVEDFKDFLNQKGSSPEDVSLYVGLQNANLLVRFDELIKELDQVEDYVDLALYFKDNFADNQAVLDEIHEEFPRQPLLFRFWKELYEKYPNLFKEVA